MSDPIGLLDTSVFIAREESRPLGELPDRVAVSVVTIGELELGVLSASSDVVRVGRADTLAFARTMAPVPISESVMSAWSRLVWDCRRAGVQRTVKLTDALIAATAIDLGVPIVTQDDDYEQMSRAHAMLRVRRV